MHTRLKLLILSCILLLAASHLFAAEPAPVPATQNEKESYSIGYQVGLSIKADGVDVDSERLVQGLQDAINEKAPLLGMEEMRTLIVEVRKRAREGQMKKLQELMVANATGVGTVPGGKQKKGRHSRPPPAACSTRC